MKHYPLTRKEAEAALACPTTHQAGWFVNGEHRSVPRKQFKARLKSYIDSFPRLRR